MAVWIGKQRDEESQADPYPLGYDSLDKEV